MDQQLNLGAIKTVVDEPVSKGLKRDIRQYRKNYSVVFLLLVLIMTGCIAFEGITSTINTNYPYVGAVVVGFGVLLAIIWFVMFSLVFKPKQKGFTELDTFRINEIYEEGVIATGPYFRVVIAWDEVVGVWFTHDMLYLRSREGEVVWQTANLTNEALSVIKTNIISHVNNNVVYEQSIPVAGTVNPYKIPSLPERQNLIAKAGYTVSKWQSAQALWGKLMLKACPYFCIIATSVAAGLVGYIDFHSLLLNNPFLWTGICLVILGLGSFLLCLIEMAEKGTQKGFLYFYPFGVVAADGKNQKFLPKENVNILQRKKTLICFEDTVYAVNLEQTYDLDKIQRYKDGLQNV